ncbi:MAG TPA: hypothetical protein VNA68_00910, partial [Candidatus Dormibacteraeota bacterium]|nr:hypothetical protein [Candidatus Dormibacteraeota bacterium]
MSAAFFVSPAYALTLEEQIRQLNQEASSQQQQAGRLRAQGDTLANKLAGINAQVSSITAQLNASRAKQVKLTEDIEAAT